MADKKPACWMALCEETRGSLFAHTKERAETLAKEAYAPRPYVVMPLYTQDEE